MASFSNIKRIFALCLMLVAIASFKGVALAAVTIDGDVTPGDIDTNPTQPGVDLVVGSAGVAGYGNMNIDGGSTVTVNNAGIGIVQPGTVFINSGSLVVGGNLVISGATGSDVSGIYFLSTDSTLDVTGNVTLSGGANGAEFTATANGAISVGGDLNVGDNVEFSLSSSDETLSVTGDMNLTGANSNVYIQQAVSVGGNLNVSGGATSTYQIVGTTTDLTEVQVTGDVVVNNGSTLSFTSGSTVEADRFIVEDQGSGAGAVIIGTGTAQQGKVIVASDGMLLNYGTVEGELDIASGGQIGREGDTPDRLTVSSGNNFNLQNGSTFIVNIDKTASPYVNDNIDVVSGNAVLESGSIVKVVPVDFSQLVNGDTFTVITANGTVTDNGVTLEQDASLFRYFDDAVVGGNTYQLTYTQNSFASVASGKNNVSVANALDNMLNSGNATPAQTAMLNNLLTFDSSAAFNNAMTQMNAEMYTIHGRNLPNQMESFNRFLGQHLTQMRNGQKQLTASANTSGLGMALASTNVDPETMAEVIESKKEADERGEALTDSGSSSNTGWSVWGQIINMWHKEKSSSRTTGYDNYAWGAVVGSDREFAPGLRIGALIGYIRSDYHMKNSRGKLDVDTLRVGPYVDWSVGKMFVEAAMTFGYHWNDAERNVNYPGFSDEDKDSNYGAWDLSPYARVGYKFDVAGWDVTPSMAFQYVHYSQNGATEHGGAAALKVDDYDNDSFRQIFLVEVSKMFDLNYLKLVPAFQVGYSYDYLHANSLDSEFIGGYPMTYYPGGTSQGHVIWGASLTALLSDELSLFVRYDGFAAGSDYTNALSSGVNYKF